MIGRVLFGAAVLAVCAGAVQAESPGTVASDPFDLGTSAAVAGMGGAASVETGIWSLGYNPAGLAEANEWRLGGTYFQWIENSSLSYGTASFPAGFAIGLLGFDLGTINTSDGFFGEGSMKVSDFGAIAGYGAKLPGQWSSIRLGLSAQYWQKNYAGFKASTFAVNLGGTYSAFAERLTVGAYVQNLGSSVKFETEEDEQPMTLAAGAGWQMGRQEKWPMTVRFVGDVIKPTDQDLVFAGGSEVVLKDVLALRAGVTTIDDETTPTFGTGVMYRSFTFDYAYATVKLLDDDTATHRLSVSFGAIGMP